MTNSNLSYIFNTVEYCYDENTKIRVGITSDKTKLAAAVDIVRALGYQSSASVRGVIKELGLVSYTMPLVFKTRKRGVAPTHLLPIESVRRLLERKCGCAEFMDWMLNVVMVKGPLDADTSKPYKKEYMQRKTSNFNKKEDVKTVVTNAEITPSVAIGQIDRIIAELVVLRQQVQANNG